MVDNAKKFDWDTVAGNWVKVFDKEHKKDVKLTVFTPTIRTGFWNIMAHNLSKQTHKNFEWLIVDDYKEDRSDIAKKYAKKYNLDIRYMRGKLDKSKYNYALIQADNMAVFNATGDVIVWLQDFILIPPDGLERIVSIHRRYPHALIAPIDEYRSMGVTPNRKNKEDWFDGEIKVVGKLLRKNVREKLGELRLTKNYYDFELNYGAIPTATARKLNGFYEFLDDGLGYNNTDIALRAVKAGVPILLDERNKAICLDLWEHLTGDDENAKDREWNLNDARFLFIYFMIKEGLLSPVRDSNFDRKLKLDNQMPKGLDQEGAAKWIQKNAKKIALRFMKELK
jgi:glycosyltransferase involved in cell wall biosynthesis